MALPNHSSIVEQVYARGSYDLRTAEGCGRFTEDAVAALHAQDPRWGHLRKNPGQTQWNGHAHDGALYLSDTPGQSQFVDFIAGAEGPSPSLSWNPDTPRYSAANWYAPEGGAQPGPIGPPTASGWTPQHGAILMALAAKGIKDTKRIAEQFAFSFPSEGWGQKSVDPSRPISNDVIAQKAGSTFVGYRVVPASQSPAPINLTGQHFVAVQPKGHVDGVVTPPTTPPANQCPDPSRHTKPDCPDPPLHQKPIPQYGNIEDTVLPDIEKRMEAEYKAVKRRSNIQASRYVLRTFYDHWIGGMPLQESIDKHVLELREDL